MPADLIDEAVRRSLAKHMDRMFTEALFGKEPVYSNAVPPPDDEGLTLEKVLAAAQALHDPTRPPSRVNAALQRRYAAEEPCFVPDTFGLGAFGGMRMEVRDAQEQARTPRDVRGPWVRPGPVPSKREGRKGTRRAWKRAHPPGYVWYYREPEDILVFDGRTAWVTPRQWDAIKRETVQERTPATR